MFVSSFFIPIHLNSVTFQFHFVFFSFLNARQFYISKSWGGCPNDKGYLLVISEVPDGTWSPCTFDIHATYPTILYAESMAGGVAFASSTGNLHLLKPPVLAGDQ